MVGSSDNKKVVIWAFHFITRLDRGQPEAHDEKWRSCYADDQRYGHRTGHRGE